MKTLDEVIAQLEAYPVSPSTLNFAVKVVSASDLEDALKYLREYKEQKNIIQKLCKMNQKIIYWVAEDGYPFDRNDVKNILWDSWEEMDTE